MKFILISAVVLTTLQFINCYELPSGSTPIEVDQVEHYKPKIEDVLKKNQNGDDWIYVDEIKSASIDVAAGTLYNIEFSAVKTDCSKNDATNSKEKCKAKESQNSCTASIWERNWQNYSEISIIDCMGIKMK